MHLDDAQRDVREAYLDGVPGMVISGALWFATAAVAARGNVRESWWLLFFGGMLIFPTVLAVVRLLGGRARMAPGNPLQGLAIQSAFLVPLGWPLVLAAGMADALWYFPAATLLVGIHYLPFVTLYGARRYGVLAGALMLTAWGCVRYLPGEPAAAAWATASIHMGAAVATLVFRRRRSALQPA